MAKRESQITMYEHSEVKVKLLQTYLQSYFNILNNSKFVGDVHYYDLFCAEGIYSNGGKGSPIIVLEAIKNSYYSLKSKNGQSGKFHCLFNDIDLSKINILKNNIENHKLHYPEIGSINFENKDYQVLCPEVSNRIKSIKKNEKAFVFIDPYGYKEIRISDIKSLLENGKSEVLLFLPTHFMFRFSENGTPESLYDFITEIVPENEWPKSKTGLEFIDNLKDAFKKYLGDSFFVDTFVITREKNQFFCLFFFTSHIYGFDRMLDAKWKLDEEDGRGWKYNASSDNLFSCIEKEPNTKKFEDALLAFLKGEPKSNKEIYEFTLRNSHLTTHTNQILKKWQGENTLIANNPDGSTGRKSSFYLSYQDYKKDKPIKLFLSLKK